MRDANTEALNRYLNEQSKVENSLDSLTDDYLEKELDNLREDIEKIINISKDYDGYDFSEDMKQIIRDMI